MHSGGDLEAVQSWRRRLLLPPVILLAAVVLPCSLIYLVSTVDTSWPLLNSLPAGVTEEMKLRRVLSSAAMEDKKTVILTTVNSAWISPGSVVAVAEPRGGEQGLQPPLGSGKSIDRLEFQPPLIASILKHIYFSPSLASCWQSPTPTLQLCLQLSNSKTPCECDPSIHPVEFQLPDWLKKRKSTPCTFKKRNLYLTKKMKRRAEDDGIFCSCSPSSAQSAVCDKDCLCGMFLSSCSQSCNCGNLCANKPFQSRPVKKMKLVETEKCGSGLVADEEIKQLDFVIEYVGEGCSSFGAISENFKIGFGLGLVISGAIRVHDDMLLAA